MSMPCQLYNCQAILWGRSAARERRSRRALAPWSYCAIAATLRGESATESTIRDAGRLWRSAFSRVLTPVSTRIVCSRPRARRRRRCPCGRPTIAVCSSGPRIALSAERIISGFGLADVIGLGARFAAADQRRDAAVAGTTPPGSDRRCRVGRDEAARADDQADRLRGCARSCTCASRRARNVVGAEVAQRVATSCSAVVRPASPTTKAVPPGPLVAEEPRRRQRRVQIASSGMFEAARAQPRREVARV